MTRPVVTAEAITEEEIREVLRSRALAKSKLMRRTIVGVALGDGARYVRDGVEMTQAAARARCAEILEARRKEGK